MPDSIDRLKKLLFESEAQTLAELADRIEILAGQTAATHSGVASSLERLIEAQGQSRAEISARIDEIAARVGTDATLEKSVSEILDGALRRAEVSHYGSVSDAVAPFVVTTVRTEIRNSRDELVEALYPVTGRIVKAYVTSAMNDLLQKINRQLEMNPVMLRLQSLATGRSVAELALAGSQRLAVEELYLIRRGTGELVERWPQEHAHNRDQVVSGVLAAINEFATEAFDAGGNTFRQIDVGDEKIFLRESVAHLLAARCSGTPQGSVEQVLDDAFLRAIEALRRGTHENRTNVLPALADTLASSLEAEHQAQAARSGAASPLKLLGVLFGLPLLAWLAWTFYADWQIARTERIARSVLSQSDEIKGYPASISVGSLGRSVTVSGLAPDLGTKQTIAGRLEAALPGVRVIDDMAAVPNPLAGVEPELNRLRGNADALQTRLAAEAEQANITRASARLARARSTLQQLLADVPSGDRPKVEDAAAAFDRTLADLGKPARSESNLRASKAAIDRASESLSRLLPARPEPLTASAAGSTPGAAILAAAENAEFIAVALNQAISLKKALPQASPRDKLKAWTRDHAIFFSDAEDYRRPAEALVLVKELATLMSGNDVVVRVVGYTDSAGVIERNSPLSVARARKVAADLAAAGVSPERLIVLGRQDANEISAADGAASPNRRVEFEIGFNGEVQP